MCIELLKKSGKLFYKGNAVLKYKIEFIRTENEEINEFYCKIAELCENFCRTQLFEIAKEENFSRCVYELKCAATLEENEILRILTSVSLKNDRNTIFEKSEEKFWEMQSGMIIKKKNKNKN